MTASLTVEQPGQLLAFLFACLPQEKKTKVRQWLKHGAVQVNGRSIKRFDHPLRAGDVVSILSKDETRVESLLPPGMKVLFDDPSLVVIEKPAGLLSIASATERNETAYAYMTDYVRRGSPRSRERVWIVHRLDREASGLMVFAKTKAAKRALQVNWSKADKRYLALVEGSPPAANGVLMSHLDESDSFKVRSAKSSNRTRHAVTRYRLTKRVATRALIEVTPETGRRNQIRVHLSDAGCPIIGDHKYGARTNPARRLGLHACSLQFEHPVSGELLKFESPLPPAIARLV